MELFFSTNGWISKYQNDVRDTISQTMWDDVTVKEYLDYADLILSNVDLVKEELMETVISEEMWKTQVFSHNDI
jgi:hypothetical protein